MAAPWFSFLRFSPLLPASQKMASLGETNLTLGRRQRIFDNASDAPQKRQYVRLLERFQMTAGSLRIFVVCRRSDPFVHHGRHFGRTVHAQQDIRVLIKHCLSHREVLEKNPGQSLSAEYADTLSFF